MLVALLFRATFNCTAIVFFTLRVGAGWTLCEYVDIIRVFFILFVILTELIKKIIHLKVKHEVFAVLWTLIIDQETIASVNLLDVV